MKKSSEKLKEAQEAIDSRNFLLQSGKIRLIPEKDVLNRKKNQEKEQRDMAKSATR